MSIDELAAVDHAYQRTVLEHAIIETRRGMVIRIAGRACSVENHIRNLARLENQLAALG